MRILGFSRKDWINYETNKPKLEEDEFSTFRFTRRDRDWGVGEVAQVVIKPRRKGGGEKLGIAEILSKERRWVGWATTLVEWITSQKDILPGRGGWGTVSHKEAVEDGFSGVLDMIKWMTKTSKDRNNREFINKLTLRWVERSNYESTN